MGLSASFDMDEGPFRPGDSVEGRYRIIRKLSAGGVGVVYHAEHAFTGASVALKALHNRASDHQDRMRVEARTLAEMRHPNIVQVTDGGVVDGVVWFTMELLKGASLRDELNRRGALGIERALRYGIQIAEGVAAAHALDVIHRDLKPENVFIVAEGDIIKVLDFGTSKITNKFRRSGELKTTDRFRLIGTQAYMPPERLRAEKADARADVYALGHILYEMLAGRHCWSEGPGPLDLPPPQELGLRQIYAPAVSLRERDRSIPAFIDRIVLRALEKDPTHRQHTMREMAEELGAARDRWSADNARPGARSPEAARIPEASGRAGRTFSPNDHPGSHLETDTQEMPVPPFSSEPVPARRTIRLGELESPSERGFRSADSRTVIDAALVCGAARFASSGEISDVEKGLRWLEVVESNDPNLRGALRTIAHGSSQTNEQWRSPMRFIFARIGANEGAERDGAVKYLHESLIKRDWEPDTEHPAPLPHAEMAIGAAMLLDQKTRSDSAEAALVRLASLDADIQSLAVSVMVAFARTPASAHPGPRGALLALLLGRPEDSELARAELATFVLSAAAAEPPRRAATLHEPSPATPPVAAVSAKATQRLASPEAVTRTSPANLFVPAASATAISAGQSPKVDRAMRPAKRINIPIVIGIGVGSFAVVLLVALAVRSSRNGPSEAAAATSAPPANSGAVAALPTTPTTTAAVADPKPAPAEPGPSAASPPLIEAARPERPARPSGPTVDRSTAAAPVTKSSTKPAAPAAGDKPAESRKLPGSGL